MIDYVTPAQRLAGANSLEAKRATAVDHLRSIGRLLIDPACKWRPTNAASTDVAATWAEARQRSAKRKKAAP